MTDPDKTKGLYVKYDVSEVTGWWEDGKPRFTKPLEARVFVMNPEKDPFAVEALWVYQSMARTHGYVALADDIRDWLNKLTADKS